MGGKRGGGTGGKRGETGEIWGRVFWTRPTRPTFAPPPPFYNSLGSSLANQIEAQALSRVRHPSPKE